MSRFRFLFVCFILAAIMFLDPVRAVFADDSSSSKEVAPEGIYSDDVPYVYHLEYIVHANGGENRLGGDFYNLNKNINAFEFIIPIVDGIVYEDYYVVFDFTLKSQLEDGTITTHTYKEQFDIAEDYSPGWFDNLLINLKLKENAYNIYFNFGKLVSNSPDLIKREKYIVNASDNVPVLAYDYNTVVSRIDAYFIKKTSGEYGMIQRFDLTWHEDFYYSCCVSVKYSLFKPDTKDVLESGSLSDDTGIYGYDSSGNNTLSVGKGVLAQLMVFLADIPVLAYEIVIGITSINTALSGLLAIVFPFLPGTALGILCFLVYFIILFSLFKILWGLKS